MKLFRPLIMLGSNVVAIIILLQKSALTQTVWVGVGKARSTQRVGRTFVEFITLIDPEELVLKNWALNKSEGSA